MARELFGWKLFLVSMALITPFLLWAGVRVYKSQYFDNHCAHHITRSIQEHKVLEHSINELNIAINYVEQHNLTTGYTSVFDYSADDDIDIFYRGLIEKRNYIQKLKDRDTELNSFIEFTEMRGYTGQSVHIPDGISIYPYNVLYFIFSIVSGILFVIGMIGLITFFDEH